MDINKILALKKDETKSFPATVVFSITDGRLGCDMDQIYKILDWIFETSFMTHHLPTAMNYLQEKNPEWYQTLTTEMRELIQGLDDWEDIHNKLLCTGKLYYIPHVASTMDISDFGEYMVNNSLLRKGQVA